MLSKGRGYEAGDKPGLHSAGSEFLVYKGIGKQPWAE